MNSCAKHESNVTQRNMIYYLNNSLEVVSWVKNSLKGISQKRKYLLKFSSHIKPFREMEKKELSSLQICQRGRDLLSRFSAV